MGAYCSFLLMAAGMILVVFRVLFLQHPTDINACYKTVADQINNLGHESTLHKYIPGY